MGTDPGEVVRGVHDGAVTTIVLDSSSNRNALSASLVGGVARLLNDAVGDDRVRFVVLTHTGGTFCAGADLSEAASEGGPAKGTGRLVELLRQIITLPKPVVAVVDGHVRAGGLGLLGACDLVLAGPRCTFALTEARLGLAPAIIALTLAAKIEPRAWARLALTGETFGPTEAARIGLVTAAIDDLETALDEVRLAFSGASPQGLAETKAVVNADLIGGFDAHAAEMAERSAALFASEEAQEGIAAFKQRRPPRWVVG